jgi:uncharacterized repeat protein (TIGR01451 family)
VRLRATDRFGSTSPWSAEHAIRIDALPPTITLAGDALTDLFEARLVRGNTLPLSGESHDNHAVGSVTICLDDDTCRAADLSTPGANSSWWSRWITARGTMDYVTRTLTIRVTDRLGNSIDEPLAVPVVFDNVPPVLVANQLLTRVPAGSTETVLSGEVADGGPDVAVSVRVEPPQGDVTRVGARRDAAAWSFDLPAKWAGRYVLWVDAQDAVGNVTTAGPFTVDVTCTDAGLAVTSLTAEPVAGQPKSLTLTITISNAGPESLPPGIPITLAEGGAPIGQVTTTVSLAAGEFQALSLDWAPGGATDFDLGVNVGEIGNLPYGPLCVAPGTALFPVSLRDLALRPGWSLISPLVNPGNTGVEVVQRGIAGPYAAILGYDGGLRAYYPDRPGDSTLTTVDASHGYWVRTPISSTTSLTDTFWSEAVATWRLAGEMLPEDRSLPLAAGWNLAGYLPHASLPVTVALQSIEGDYASVLGFAGTAVSYYPDLDASYNTLAWLRPSAAYWISATQAITLEYPPASAWWDTVPITATPTITQALASLIRLAKVRADEEAAGVLPTYNWANLYGQVYLPDGSPAPISSTLTVLADGSPCGATRTTEAGQFGLLACYGDDATTPAVDGALPGASLTFLLDGAAVEAYPIRFNGQPAADGQPVRWTGHGDRWELALGKAPQAVDLAIAKTVMPAAAAPGDPITFTLTYSNVGNLLAHGVVVADRLPLEIIMPAFTGDGALDDAEGYRIIVWNIGELAAGAGATITLTGRLIPALTGPATITNTATIAGLGDTKLTNNRAEVTLHVIQAPALKPVIWLPLVVQDARREAAD